MVGERSGSLSRWGWAILGGLVAGFALAALLLAAVLGVSLGLSSLAAVGAGCSAAATQTTGSGPVAGADIPAADIPIFQGAAARYGLGPHGASLLAAINEVESDFGLSDLPGVHSGANFAGAEGPMQFEPGTFDPPPFGSGMGVGAPGDPPGQPPNVYDEADAVYSAAHYLSTSGMTSDPATWDAAIFSYNHASSYVDEVIARAQIYYEQGLADGGSGGSGQVPVAAPAPAEPSATLGPPALVAAAIAPTAASSGSAGPSPGPSAIFTELTAPGGSGLLGNLPMLAGVELTNPRTDTSLLAYKAGTSPPPAATPRTVDGARVSLLLPSPVAAQLDLDGPGVLQISRVPATPATPDAGAACGGTATPAAPGEYVDPLRAATTLVAERIDQGVDYAGTGPILALGDGVLTYLAPATANGWPGEWFLAYRLSDGPDAGLTVYVAEGIDPAPGLTVGQSVSAGQKIASFIPDSGTGIETGWDQGVGAFEPIAQIDGGYVEGERTAAGNAFSGLLASLGAPPGQIDDPPGVYRPIVGHYP